MERPRRNRSGRTLKRHYSCPDSQLSTVPKSAARPSPGKENGQARDEARGLVEGAPVYPVQGVLVVPPGDHSPLVKAHM